MRKLILSLLFLSSLRAFGQEEIISPINITLGYYGETITHPGLMVGVEYAPVTSGKYQMLLALNVGGYVHKRNNTSFFIRGQWGQRVTFGNGLFVEQFLGLGYLHQFSHGGELYEVLPGGAVVETPDRGQPKFMPSVTLGTGYDFSKKGIANVSIYLRPELFWKAPFNGYYLTHPALSTGIISKF
ncbi:MAG: hypothetical protein WA960_03520 [Tunicatimonas sp.]